MKHKFLSIGFLILLITSCSTISTSSSDEIDSNNSSSFNISEDSNTNSDKSFTTDSSDDKSSFSKDDKKYIESTIIFTNSTDKSLLKTTNININSFTSSNCFTDVNNALRLGSGKNLGSISLTFDSILVNNIYIYGSVYGTDGYSDLKITAESSYFQSKFENNYVCFDLKSDINLTSFKLETTTTKKRFNLSKIVFNLDGSSDGNNTTSSSSNSEDISSDSTDTSSNSSTTSGSVEHGDYKYLYNNSLENSRGSLGSVDSYYESCRGLKGTALKNELSSIINNGKKTFNYDHLLESFKVTDVDPYNSKNIILCYTQERYTVSSLSNFSGYVNREHIWPNSRGVGKDGPGADKHMQHPCEKDINGRRSNLDFGTVKGTSGAVDLGASNSINKGNYYNSKYFEPADFFKGDVARTVFYMATCYSSLEVSGTNINTSLFNTYSSTYGLGNFNDLYSWATSGIDPVDDFEVNRNNLIDQKYQHNRNPFVDHPEFIIMIYDKTYNGAGALNDY